MIYLDYAATTPISDHALTVYGKAAKNVFANSNSLHDLGEMAAGTLQSARKLIAESINGLERGLYFTSGGSESNLLAVQSLLNGLDLDKKHIITTQLEHSSLYNYFKKLMGEGYEVTFLRPNEKGLISLTQLDKALRNNTGLVSIQHGNSEIGTVQAIDKIGPFLKKKGILFHSDCVQTYGKLPIDIDLYKVDSISFSSHKIYGPKGIGAAYIHPSVHWKPVIPGTTHEFGFRPGTVDVPGVAAFAVAANEITNNLISNYDHFQELKSKFIDLLGPHRDKIILLNKNLDHTLPSILPLIVDGIEGQYIMLECNRYGFAVSTGSACQIGMQAPSRTLLAMNYDEQKAKQYIRVSLGLDTTKEDLETFVEVLTKIIKTFNNKRI